MTFGRRKGPGRRSSLSQEERRDRDRLYKHARNEAVRLERVARDETIRRQSDGLTNRQRDAAAALVRMEQFRQRRSEEMALIAAAIDLVLEKHIRGPGFQAQADGGEPQVF